MNALTLYDKLWQSHLVHEEADGTALIYIDRHLLHEVTSPQAFEGLAIAGRKPWRIGSVVATADHNVPTQGPRAGHRRPHRAPAGRDARPQRREVRRAGLLRHEPTRARASST